jgi:hypothetical protein
MDTNEWQPSGNGSVPYSVLEFNFAKFVFAKFAVFYEIITLRNTYFKCPTPGNSRFLSGIYHSKPLLGVKTQPPPTTGSTWCEDPASLFPDLFRSMDTDSDQPGSVLFPEKPDVRTSPENNMYTCNYLD